MKRQATLLIAVLCAVGCRGPGPKKVYEHGEKKVYEPGEKGCSAGAYWTALNKLNPILHLQADKEHTLKEIEDKIGRAQCIREWIPSVPDPCLRVNYEGWLSSYDIELSDARETVLHPEAAKPKEEAEWVRMERLQREYAAGHKVPDPPICERVK